MNLTGPLIEEDFVVAGNTLTRMLSVDGATGFSQVVLDEQPPVDSPRTDLLSIWDKSFLAGLVEYPANRDSRDAIRIADVFCGAGGLSYGVREAVRACGLRAKSVFAADMDPVTMDVHRRNLDPIGYAIQDLWDSVTKNYSTRGKRARFLAPPKLLAEELKVVCGRVDILLGGPPCEGHSTSNNVTLRDDPRNRYYIVMPALAVALGAKAVIVENVPGIRHDAQGVLDAAKGLFEGNGYYLDEKVVDAMAVGLPQTRKRHILVASKVARPNIEAAITQVARPPRDLRWVIGDLMDAESEDLMDTAAELSEVNRRRIRYLFDNDQYDLPNEQRPDSHRGGHTYPSIYGRLHWDKPSGTITTGFNTPGRGRYIHPERQRTLTPHEAARIQGFPDSFEFKTIVGDTPTRSSLADMIGDAVPPPIGYAAGIAALAALNMGASSS